MRGASPRSPEWGLLVRAERKRGEKGRARQAAACIVHGVTSSESILILPLLLLLSLLTRTIGALVSCHSHYSRSRVFFPARGSHFPNVEVGALHHEPFPQSPNTAQLLALLEKGKGENY